MKEVGESRVVTVPAAAASVADARHRMIADLLAAGVLDEPASDAALVLSELLSNAIRHARPLCGAQLRVMWAIADGAVEVSVSDGGSTTRPRAGDAPVSSVGGRGLGIVEHLSRTWGVDSDAAGSTVWAVLAAPAHRAGGMAPAAR